jgi:hypothetical protein
MRVNSRQVHTFKPLIISCSGFISNTFLDRMKSKDDVSPIDWALINLLTNSDELLTTLNCLGKLENHHRFTINKDLPLHIG